MVYKYFMDKDELRQKYRDIRRYENLKVRGNDLEPLYTNLYSIPEFSSANTLMLYMSKQTEVPTKPIVSKLLDEEKNVILPRVDADTKTMNAYQIKSLEELEISMLEILEPKLLYTPINPKDIDVIIVPGVAFDISGNRLGRGGGYYDRFLDLVSAPKIAICYDAQIAESLPSQAHDVKMDYIVTEKRILSSKEVSDDS
jgi:5-formyltetrahydrofolate cyclo-ligase